ncbi:MAG TPA: alpha/beta hydrolase [Jatrophihabitans sp.]|nr:alpha/beta hydrolase [Jatrophihabitans sp.]
MPGLLTSASDRELHEVQIAEEAGRPVVVFLHGLWLLPDCWDGWRHRFEARGYSTVVADWPQQPTAVAEARGAPELIAGLSLKRIADHAASVISMLSARPVLIGHCLGGLVAQELAARGLAAATVAVAPLPPRGGFALSPTSLRAAWPELRRRNAHLPSRTWFRASFANTVHEDEARHLYERYAVPASGRLLADSLFAESFLTNPRRDTTARLHVDHPGRGPMKIISGERDRLVPWPLARATFLRQLRSPAHTEFFEFDGRGHSMPIDSGWRHIADTAFRFVHRMAARAVK